MYVLVQQVPGLANKDTSWRLVISFRKSLSIFLVR